MAAGRGRTRRYRSLRRARWPRGGRQWLSGVLFGCASCRDCAAWLGVACVRGRVWAPKRRRRHGGPVPERAGHRPGIAGDGRGPRLAVVTCWGWCCLLFPAPGNSSHGPGAPRRWPRGPRAGPILGGPRLGGACLKAIGGLGAVVSSLPRGRGEGYRGPLGERPGELVCERPAGAGPGAAENASSRQKQPHPARTSPVDTAKTASARLA